jgi:hypothetical protein
MNTDSRGRRARRVDLRLTDEQYAQLQRRASTTGRSVSALVRQAVNDWLVAIGGRAPEAHQPSTRRDEG